MAITSDEFLKAFLEELTGCDVRGHKGGFKIFVRIKPKVENEYAWVRFTDDQETMVVGFDGDTYFFELGNKDWIDNFKEIWERKIRKLRSKPV